MFLHVRFTKCLDHVIEIVKHGFMFDYLCLALARLNSDVTAYLVCHLVLLERQTSFSLDFFIPKIISSNYKVACGLFLCFISALEFLSTCKVANLSIKAELGCCLLHRSGRLTVEGCVLECESNPLDHLSCPIISTASSSDALSTLNSLDRHSCPIIKTIEKADSPTSAIKKHGNSVTVSRTRIEGGARAVSTKGSLVLQHVRVIYARTSLFFWFDVEDRSR